MMNPLAPSPTSSASPPLEAAIIEEGNSSTPESTARDRSRKFIMHASIFASLVAFGWYLNKGIGTSINYHNLSEEFGKWEPSWALVTGRNKTYPGISSVGPFLPFFTDDPFYCAQVAYETLDGDRVVATSLTNCGHLPTEVEIGEKMEILYNPDNTQEFLEKNVVDDSLDALIGALAIVFVFALGFLSCAISLWKTRDVPIGLERHAHRRRPVPRRVRDDEEGIEMTPEELELQKREREEKIKMHFRFQTISENGADASFAPSLTKSTSEDGSQSTEPSTSTEISQPEDDHTDECCICMERYCKGDPICTPTTDGCKHVFHKACLLEWLQRHDHCPLCRVNLMQDQ